MRMVGICYVSTFSFKQILHGRADFGFGIFLWCRKATKLDELADAQGLPHFVLIVFDAN
jgi:hypothetical protein